MKSWRAFLLLVAACPLAGYVTASVVGPSLIYNSVPLTRDIREEDRKFLEVLIQKQNQDDLLASNSLSSAIQNIGQAAMTGSSNEPAPKAELNNSSEIVRRAELVLHNKRIKRAELVRRRYQ